MKTRQLMLVAVLAIFASAVSAGLATQGPVLINLGDDGSGAAQGDQVTARFSDNDGEFIGCGSRSTDDGNGNIFDFGFCQAEDANGTMGFCSTFSPNLVAAIRALSDFSFITFGWNEAGECTRVGSSTQSFYIPSFKLKKHD